MHAQNMHTHMQTHSKHTLIFRGDFALERVNVADDKEQIYTKNNDK